MKKSFWQKIFSFIAAFSLFFNSLHPFLFLAIPSIIKASVKLELKISFEKKTNNFKIELNNKDAGISGKLSYVLVYRTEEQSEAVEGNEIELKEKNFSREIYAGTCSENGQVCIPHNVLRGVLKTEIKEENWLKSQWFEIKDGSLNLVKEEDSKKLELTEEENQWVEEKKINQEKESLDNKSICLNNESIVESTIFDWNINEVLGVAETKEKIRLGVKYTFPLEKKVTITFKCLPKDENLRSLLKIKKIKISDLNISEDINPYGDWAYDINTEMLDGSFKYDITLPKPEEKEVKVVYMEDEKSEIKKIEDEKLDQRKDEVEIKGLDHLTIFFVDEGKDLTNLLDPEVLNVYEINQLKESDNKRYETNGYWPIFWILPYQQNQYLEFRFKPNIPSNAKINSVKIYFEYQRDPFASGSNERDARIRAWDGDGFDVEIADYDDLELSTYNTDEKKIISVPLNLVNTPQKVNNFKFRFYMRGRGPWYKPLLKTRHDYVALDVDYTLLSDVTICKQDTNQNPLSNWRVYLLGNKVDSLNIPSNGSIVGKSYSSDNYVLLASGVYKYGDERMNADAANSYRYVGLPCATTNGWVNGEAVSCMNNYLSLNFSVSGGPTGPGWGLYYNPEHKYTKSFSGGALNLKIWDACSTGSQGNFIGDDCYHDNEGSLTLDVYKGYVGDTGQNGCVTFKDVPYGNYILDEILQDGWERVSGTGEITIDSESKRFTIVNKNIQTVKINGKKFNDINYNSNLDNGEIGLANWKIYAAQKVDEVEVPAKDMPTIPSNISLENGQKYLLRVSGTYKAGDNITADAKYSVRAPNTYWTDYVQNYESWGSTLLDLQINQTSVNWGSYNNNHIYWLTYQGAGSPINFRLYDFYPSNNTGSLSVKIYKVIKETITDQNGNYSLELSKNLSGEVIIAEETQDNWIQTAPIGNNFGYCLVDFNSQHTCNFGNAQAKGWIIVEKQTNPSGSIQEFNFSGNQLSGKIKDDQKLISSELAPGLYTVTEDIINGWNLISINCDDIKSNNPSQGDLNKREANFGLDPGEIVKCVFTNTQTGSISIHKFEDINGDGDIDANDNGLENWEFNLYKGKDCQDNDLITNGKTDSQGNLKFDNLVVGDYSVKEILQNGWKNTTLICQNIQVIAGGNSSVNFGNFKLGYIQGRKYKDLNQNGTDDNNEPWLSGWKINLYDSNWQFINSLTTTGSGGLYRFENLDKGTYYTCEELKDNWTQTGPILGNNRVVNQSPNKEKEGPVCWRSVINKSGQSVTGRRFGNIQYGSISGYKWEDLDGDGVWNKGNEPVINGDQTQVTIFIDLNKNGEQEEGEPRTGITNNGSYSFTNLLPGSYNVCERDDLLSGWIATTPKCYEVNVNAGQETKDINFGNFKLGRLTVTKFHDRNQDGKKDDDEEVLGGWIINLASNSGTLSGITATNSGQLVFDNLLAGDYSLSEEKQSDWRLTNIYCDNYQGSYQNDFYSLTIKSRDILDCYLGNYHQPILTLAKSNNVYPNSTTPGSVVSFTLKIKVQNNNLYNVLVKDILPPEFSFNNVWSATLNGKSITLADPHYASPGTWILGDLKEGDEIMINYQAKVKNSVQPGVYKDLAWGVGNEIDDQNSNKILALSTDSGTADSGIVDKNFVGTKVVVDKDTQNYTSVDIKKEETKEETGQVLGASTGLPATGSKFIWLIIGSVFSLLGLILIGLGLSWKKIKLFNRILGLIIVLGTCSLITNNVFAGSLSVRLSEPKSPTRTSDFNLNFVALDFVNNPIAVKCFYKKDGGSYQQFDSVKNLSAGGNAGSCRVTNSQLNEEGKTYSFYVEADNGTETVMSEIVSVDYKTSTPGTPTNYSKEHPSSCEYKIKFKTADDGGKTKKVEIYRSRDTSFPLDGSTRTASIPIGSNTDYTYTETVPSGYCNDTWYYAVRAFDDAGNGSGWVGDAIVTIKTVSTTTTQTTTQETGGAIPVANVTLPAETTTGNIEGATTEEKKTEEITKVEESEKKEEVLGEKTERKSKNIMEKAGEVLGQATKKENKNKILFAVLAMVLLSIIGYAAYNIKNQRQKSQT